MRFGSLFAGIGGFDLGLERAGMKCAWQVEIDDYCNRVLEKHWPGVARFGDIRDVRGEELESVDLICGGFPCQTVSNAGRMEGQNDERWLWPEYARIIRQVRPRWVLVENVRGLLSANNGGAFTEILRDLAACGFDAEWRIISACQFGAPHTRERVFIVAYSSSYGREGILWEAETQEIPDISFETLDVWNRSSNPFANHEERLARPGSRKLPDGIPSTLAIRPALRAYGNAVVPQVAQWIGERIMEVEYG